MLHLHLAASQSPRCGDTYLKSSLGNYEDYIEENEDDEDTCMLGLWKFLWRSDKYCVLIVGDTDFIFAQLPKAFWKKNYGSQTMETINFNPEKYLLLAKYFMVLIIGYQKFTLTRFNM